MFSISDVVAEFGFSKVARLIAKMWLSDRLSRVQTVVALSQLQDYHNFCHPNSTKVYSLDRLEKTLLEVVEDVNPL